jgi:hypothetical protein
VLHVDIETLRQNGKKPGPQHEHCHLDEKPWVSPATARRLCCDASLVTVLEDKNGQVLNVGRRSRTVPAPIGRALRERDRTCRFPGCCEARYTDAHHIQHWAMGETNFESWCLVYLPATGMPGSWFLDAKRGPMHTSYSPTPSARERKAAHPSSRQRNRRRTPRRLAPVPPYHESGTAWRSALPAEIVPAAKKAEECRP